MKPQLRRILSRIIIWLAACAVIGPLVFAVIQLAFNNSGFALSLFAAFIIACLIVWAADNYNAK